MKEIIERFKSLKTLYPNRVTIYPPIDKKLIEDSEKSLSIKIDNSLDSLFGYSNGLSIISYHLLGFGNRKLLDFTDINLATWEGLPELTQRYVVFMTCSGGGPDYGYLVDRNKDKHKVVVRKDPMDSNLHVIADSIESFFEIFLKKIEVLLETMNPKELIAEIPEWEH